MSLYGKTTFGRACGASLKSNFSDLLFKVPYVPNKPFFFQGLKNHSEAEFCQPWAASVRLNTPQMPKAGKTRLRSDFSPLEKRRAYFAYLGHLKANRKN